jgi:hypothetical protein
MKENPQLVVTNLSLSLSMFLIQLKKPIQHINVAIHVCMKVICIDSIVPLKVDNFIIESSNEISIFYSLIIEIQLRLTLYSSIFLNSLQFLFQEWHHSCSTISFFLLTHLAFDWLKVYIDFLFLFGLPSFLFLFTRVFFKLALNHLVCITYHLTQSFNLVWNFILCLK